MNKIQNIQALRGIAVLFVIFFHLVSIEKKYGGTNTILPDFFQFGMFGVDLFFVISGFVIVTVTQGKFRIPKQAFRFIYHRTTRIYPTYWFYTLLVLIIFLVQPAWVNSSQGSQVDILSSFLLIPSQTLPLVMVGWTLIHEMYFYLIYFFIFLFIPERYLTHTLLIWATVVALFNLTLNSNDPVINTIVHPLTIEFLTGGLLAIIHYKNNIKIKTRLLLILVGLSLFASIAGYLLYNHLTGAIEPVAWWRIAIFGAPAAFMVYGLTNAERNKYILHSSLIRVGNVSYSLYLSHILSLSALGKIWSLFSTDDILDNIIMLPVLVILTLLIGFISYRFIEKPLLNLTRKIA